MISKYIWHFSLHWYIEMDPFILSIFSYYISCLNFIFFNNSKNFIWKHVFSYYIHSIREDHESLSHKLLSITGPGDFLFVLNVWWTWQLWQQNVTVTDKMRELVSHKMIRLIGLSEWRHLIINVLTLRVRSSMNLD